MKHKLIILFSSIILLTPILAFAQTSSCSLALRSNPKFSDLISYITCNIQLVVPVIFILALVVFLWGVVQYVINTDDEAKKSKGKEFMVWGIIGLTVMFSVWGLVKIVSTTFGVDTSFIPSVRSPAN